MSASDAGFELALISHLRPSQNNPELSDAAFPSLNVIRGDLVCLDCNKLEDLTQFGDPFETVGCTEIGVLYESALWLHM